MKIYILSGICACLIGCALADVDGGSEAPGTSEGPDSAAIAVKSEATTAKYAEAENVTSAAVPIDASDIRAFHSLVEEEASESVAVRSKFDPNRTHKLEAFRGRLEVQQ